MRFARQFALLWPEDQHWHRDHRQLRALEQHRLPIEQYDGLQWQWWSREQRLVRCAATAIGRVIAGHHIGWLRDTVSHQMCRIRNGIRPLQRDGRTERKAEHAQACRIDMRGKARGGTRGVPRPCYLQRTQRQTSFAMNDAITTKPRRSTPAAGSCSTSGAPPPTPPPCDSSTTGKRPGANGASQLAGIGNGPACQECSSVWVGYQISASNGVFAAMVMRATPTWNGAVSANAAVADTRTSRTAKYNARIEIDALRSCATAGGMRCVAKELEPQMHTDIWCWFRHRYVRARDQAQGRIDRTKSSGPFFWRTVPLRRDGSFLADAQFTRHAL